MFWNRKRLFRWQFGLFSFFFFVLTACVRPSAAPQMAAVAQPLPATIELLATPTLAATQNGLILPTETPLPATNTPVFTPTPFYTGTPSPPCGLSLPVLPTNRDAEVTAVSPDPDTLARLQSSMPAAARPALERLLEAPETVGLAAFRMGDEANGVYFNADMQMPLASVSKLLHLVAYAEAVGSGQLDSTQLIPVTDLERFYLPGYDLGAHNRSLRALEEAGRLFTDPDRVQLEDVPWLMTRYSSNSAADYLHDLLGQARIEQTAVSLNLTSQTAPCTWLGQFLAMGNHMRQLASDRQAVLAYVEDPARYGAEAALLADAFSNDEAFRQAEIEWHGATRRPSVETQRLFGHELNAHGTAGEYAGLMVRLAQNGLSNAESSFLARRYLEWPMVFDDNQALFSNLGYKNGALPGILNTAYYAYRQGETTPVVVVLFYKDLPEQTYRQWRRDALPHDEFARWLLADPQAIPLLANLLSGSE